MSRLQDLCEDLSIELRSGKSFDERLGILLSHKANCCCGQLNEIEQLIEHLIWMRYELQIRRRGRGTASANPFGSSDTLASEV